MLVAFIMWPSFANADWKSTDFRDEWLLQRCKKKPGLIHPVQIPALSRPPIVIPVPGHDPIIIPLDNDCPTNEVLKSRLNAELSTLRHQQRLIIESLNREWSGGPDDQYPVQKWIYKFTPRNLAALYAGDRCLVSSPCFRTAFLSDDGLIAVHDETFRTSDQGPPFVYALHLEYSDLQMGLSFVREAFGAYRARANVPDDNEWALLPLYDYPADFTIFGVAECGAIGRSWETEFPAGRTSSGLPGGMVKRTVRNNVAIVFLARMNDLPGPIDRWVTEENGVQTLHYWSINGCSSEPDNAKLAEYLSIAMAGVAQ